MGLFGGDSKSSSSTSNRIDTRTTTHQTDNSGNTGILGGGSVRVSNVERTTIQQSDSGAIKAATSIAQSGLSASRASTTQALGFGSAALKSVTAANHDSLKLLTGLVSGALDNSKTLARDSIAASAASSKAAVTGFAALAKTTSESTDDRVGRVALYAFAALAAVFVLPALFKGGGKAVI